MTIEKEKLPVIYNSENTKGFNYEITFYRSELTRNSRWFKRKKNLFHQEVIEKLDALRRDSEGNHVFCLNKNTIRTALDCIDPDFFEFNPHEQSINVHVKVKPFWKNKDKKQRLLGYVLEIISTVNRGGNLYKRIVGGVELPKELVLIRMPVIDMAKDIHDKDNCFVKWNPEYSMTTIRTA